VVSSESGQTRQGLTFGQKLALAVVGAVVLLIVLVYVASATLQSG
jgi:hypothetical protein